MTPATAWRTGLEYSRTGVRRCQTRRQLFGFMTVLFCLPLVLALALSVGMPQAAWVGPVTFVLSSITVIGGGLSLMVAVEASVRGESIGLSTILRRAVGYLPKYILTNAHT